MLGVLSGVSEQQFKRRPETADGGEAGWCIAEVLAHQLATDNLWVTRIRAALTGEAPEIAPSDPALHEEQARAGRHTPVPQLIHGLLATRRELERLIGAAGDEGLQRTVRHATRGTLTVAWMIEQYGIGHELEHVAQIAALRQSLASVASGR